MTETEPIAVTVRGFVLRAPRTLSLETWPLPPPPPGWARIKVLACAICGSDVSHVQGRRPFAEPMTLGHEFVGVVESLGDDNSPALKDAVITSDFGIRCGRCDQCRAGRSHLCRDRLVPRYSNRAFASHLNVRADVLYPIKATGMVARFALTEPLACALHALDSLMEAPSDGPLLVVGAGGLGSLAAHALAARPDPVEFVVTDTNKTRLDRMAVALRGSRGMAVAGPEGEFDRVLDTTGTPHGLRRAISHVRPGGRLTSLSHLDGHPDAPSVMALARSDIAFRLSYLTGDRHVRTALGLLIEAWGPSWAATVDVSSWRTLGRAFERRDASGAGKQIIDLSDLRAA